ncbi:MAG: fibronectin type III domain-containing protein [Limisphaerales bacterium]
MGLRAPRTPVGPVAVPQYQQATMGDNEGTDDLQWEPVSGANSYVVEYSPNPTGPWTQSAIVTRSSHTVGGLTSGTKYWFRVRAVGAAGPGPWSDPAMKMAT